MKRSIFRFATTVLSIYLCTAIAFARELIPVGQLIGLELSAGTVTVAAFDDALPVGRQSGLQIGDEIVTIDDTAIRCAEDVRKALRCSDGSVDMVISRSGKEKRIHIQPEITTSGPKLGVYLKQGITGIGTVTYYDPQTKQFGTLGHGVNDGKGSLLSMTRGNAYPAAIASVQKGKAGAPGQLKGALSGSQVLGILSGNTPQGVFGTAPEGWTGQAIPTASAEEVRTGSATICSTVSGSTPREYSVEILKIYPKDRTDCRNLLIRITDPALLETTGGIIQGMGVSYNKDNLEKPLACKGFWCQSLFLLTSKIACIKRRCTRTESP